MRTMLLIVALALIAREAVAQSSQAGECVNSGGSWDEAKSAPPYCECPSGLKNSIPAGGICSRQVPFCDRCVAAGVVERPRVPAVPRVETRAAAANPEDVCKALCAGDPQARWNADAPKGQRCEPLDAAAYSAGPCLIFPKVQLPPAVDESAACRSVCEHDPKARWVAEAAEGQQCQPRDRAGDRYWPGSCGLREIVEVGATSIDLCVGSGGGPVGEHGCVCPAGTVLQTRVCVPALPGEVRWRLGADLEAVTIIESNARLPVGLAPRLTLRIVPPRDIYFLAAAGPLLHGTGGETPNTPVGVNASLGLGAALCEIARGQFHLGFTADSHWIAVDRRLKMEALGAGVALRARQYWGPCFVGIGAGATNLLPRSGWGAFLGTIGGGCELP